MLQQLLGRILAVPPDEVDVVIVMAGEDLLQHPGRNAIDCGILRICSGQQCSEIRAVVFECKIDRTLAGAVPNFPVRATIEQDLRDLEFTRRHRSMEQRVAPLGAQCSVDLKTIG